MVILRFVSVFASAFALACAAHTQTTADTFGRAEEAWSAQVSPNGSLLATGCSPTGKRAICIFSIGGGAKPKMIPAPDGARINSLYWASDDYLIYTMSFFETLSLSSGLREVTISRALSYSMKTGKTVMLMRDGRGLTDTTTIDSLLVDDEDKVLMSFTVRTDDEPETGRLVSTGGGYSLIVLEVDLKDGEDKIVDRSSRSIWRAAYDETGERLAEIEWDIKRETFRIVSLLKGRKTVFERRNTQRFPFNGVEGLTNDRQGLIVNFDDVDRTGLHVISLVDGAISPYEIGGIGGADVGLLKDRWTNQISGYHYTDDLDRVVYTDATLAAYQSDLKAALGADTVWLTSWSKDRSAFTVRAQSMGRPADYFLFETEGPSVSPVGGEAPWLMETPLGQVSRADYTASDGLTIPAYLTLPPGTSKSDGPFPLVLMPHGGPETRDDAAYDWLAQAVAAEGFAVLQPNFRGSAGYGKAFRDAGYNEFGGLMVQDVLDGATAMVAEGVAKPEGVCAVGASYGGYSALMAALKAPDTVGCVVSINGVTAPFAMISEYGIDSPLTAYLESYMGDVFKTSRDAQAQISPASRAAELSMPVLLIHGNEDTTVPIGQATQLMRTANGKPNIRLETLEGADHYLTATVTRQSVLRSSIAHLKGSHPAAKN
ncbi:MAG: alpha/beta fold hydrolase [Pseudomonadota bacterium]